MIESAELIAKIFNESKNIKYNPEEYAKKQVDWYNESKGNIDEYDGYNCDICRNKGYIAYLDECGCEIHKYCKCMKVRKTLRRAQSSGLGDILADYTFDKFNAVEDWQKKMLITAKAFCDDDESKWFYIGGQSGAGKTHICTAICGKFIKSGYDVKYMIWSDEAKKLKAMVNNYEYQSTIEIYKNIDVLYIDDFLKVKSGENPTPADINLAFEIINHRLISKDKITIISSEKTLDELMEYDEATMSRIYMRSGRFKLNIEKDRNKNYRLRE